MSRFKLRIVAAVLLVHGAIHLLGFTWATGVAEVEGMGAPSLFWPGSQPGDPLMVVFGFLWLIAAVYFVVAGLGLAFGKPWSVQLTGFAAVISVPLTVIWWRDAWIGAVVSTVILILIALVQRGESLSAYLRPSTPLASPSSSTQLPPRRLRRQAVPADADCSELRSTNFRHTALGRASFDAVDRSGQKTSFGHPRELDKGDGA